MDLKNYNFEIEESILCCLLLKPKLFNEIYLEGKHFFKYRNIFEFLKYFYSNNKNLDLSLISTDSKCTNEIMIVLAEIINKEPSPSFFNEYQDKQFELYKKNVLMNLTKKFLQEEISIQDFEEKYTKIKKESSPKIETKSDDDIYNLITKRENFLEFDKLSFIQDKAHLVINTFNIIAARPSNGKTSLALNFLLDLSKKYHCLFFNLEMSEKEIYQRIVAIESGIALNYVCNPQTDTQKRAIYNYIHSINREKIKIISGSKNLYAIKSIIAHEQTKGHTIVFIDYIGLIKHEKANQPDRERIGEITRELESMTTDYNITFFCLAQINREGDEAPQAKHLKDSGELEQAAQTLLIIHNDSDNPLQDLKPQTKIILAKNRSGERGYIDSIFNKLNQTFYKG